MGQKTHPIGFRLGVNKTWDSRWFAKRGYSDLLHEDIRLRKFIREKLSSAGIAKVEIALGQGKKQYDKREDIKKRDIKRELSRVVKQRRK